MNSTLNSGLISRWIGLSLDEALNVTVDAVSGATLTSTALISTIERTVQYSTNTATISKTDWWNTKTIIGLLVVILGGVVSFIPKSKVLRIIQLALNVIVLGFWCGSFLSLSQLVNWWSNGVDLAVAAVPFALLLSAIIIPLFGKKGHYCAWHCPLGSLQELAGKCSKRKLTLSPALLKYLNYLREGLLFTLLFMMWIGVGFSFIDYELFSAFLFNSANMTVVFLSLLFIILSIFIQRPYCRFVCPTGSLLKFITNIK